MNERNDMISPSISTSTSVLTKSGNQRMEPFKVYAVGNKHYIFRGTLTHAGQVLTKETTEIPADIWQEGRKFYPIVKPDGTGWKIVYAYHD